MASSLFRLRRAVSLSSSLLRPLSTVIPHRNPNTNPTSAAQSRHFRSSPLSLSSARDSFRSNNNNNNYNGNLDDEIGPDTILFEGCDYNHWLITMDFPKDPAPTREEMIETYLQTLAKVVGSYMAVRVKRNVDHIESLISCFSFELNLFGSYEEAKKKMYACSTTTYMGFQCLVSEEESEKFKNLPGVVFVLPDSYLDPVNKEYGGDKYENGIITPRPPPMQYGRQGGRYGDRNRDFNRNPRQMPSEQGSRGYDNQRPRYEDNRNFNQQQNPSMPNHNQGYDNQRPRFGDNRNFGPQPNTQVPNHQPSPSYANQGQNPQVQPNYGPTAGGERRDPLHNNYHQVQNQQPSSGYANQGPAYGVNRPERHPPVQPNYGSTVGGERTDSLPTNGSPWGRDAMPNYQNQQGFHNPQGERVPEQRGYTGETRNYATPQGGVPQGQGAEGNYGQMGGGNGQGSGGHSGQTQGGSFVNGVYVRNHPPSFNYQNDYTSTEEAEILKDTQSQQRNYVQMGQTENQGRY